MTEDLDALGVELLHERMRAEQRSAALAASTCKPVRKQTHTCTLPNVADEDDTVRCRCGLLWWCRAAYAGSLEWEGTGLFRKYKGGMPVRKRVLLYATPSLLFACVMGLFGVFVNASLLFALGGLIPMIAITAAVFDTKHIGYKARNQRVRRTDV